MVRYLSLFSGIEAASVAWGPLGWTPVAFAEIDPFASAVLAHHHPGVPNLGDVTAVTEAQVTALGPIDVVVFGFPCQDVSVAGKRAGLVGARSGLFYDAMRIVRWSRARWAVAENVPGLFSSHGGRDFAAVVGAMVGSEFGVPGDGWQSCGAATGPDGMVEWGVLDAQWFGLAQRRKRVFLVRDTGDWLHRPPVLLEQSGLRGDSAPRREAGEGAPAKSVRCATGGIDREDMHTLIPSVLAHGQANAEVVRDGSPSLTCQHEAPIVVHSLRASGFDASEDGTGRGTPLVPVGFNWQNGGGFGEAHDGLGITEDGTGQLQRSQVPAVAQAMAVRRLLPVECCRLQGFPDTYLDIIYRGKPAADGNKYKALGNSMAVPVMRWIGERIQAVESIHD